MGCCGYHPERNAVHYCVKYGRHLCEECGHCVDPLQYCKFRSACTIWFLDKERKRLAKVREDAGDGGPHE